MLRSLLPWAIAGLAGWYVPRLFRLYEEWQRALVAALSGACVGWVLTYL